MPTYHMDQPNKPRPEKNQTSFQDVAVSSANMWRGFQLSAIISGYILGPLLLFGGLAWWLHKAGHINKFIVIVAVLIAFAVSNILIITRAKKLVESFNKKTGIKDPTAAEAAAWRESRGKSYKYDEDEEND